MQNLIKQEIEKLGGQVRLVSISALKTIENDTYAVQNGEYKSDLIDLIARDFFSFNLPDIGFQIRSIVVVAMPSPHVMVRFNWKGKVYDFPNEHYLEYNRNKQKAESTLNALLNPIGYNVKEVENLPMKPLAVRSGLSLYGRNNITYVEGMGSLVSLQAFYSDIYCESETLCELEKMAACESCTQCLISCPTGAIKTDRHVIRAEQCLTYLNEFIDADGFPDWLSPYAHNSLHGCMVCQTVCPKNKPYIQNIEVPIEFDEDETRLILEGTSLDVLPPIMIEKVRLLCLEDYLPLLPRNLSVLLAK